MSTFDVLVRGGEVVDGTGAGPRRADVGVRGASIAAVGDLSAADADQVVDASGSLVLPGFVDAHAHADALLGDPRVQEACLRQGVTTVVVGQDGVSFAPSSADAARWASRYFAAVNGSAPAGLATGASVERFLDSLDRCGAVNAAVLVPAGLVRAEVMGLDARPATAHELRRMAALVAEGMEAGAIGLSTGLDYVPGSFADTDELATLAAPAGERGGVYVSHLRGYARDRVRDSLAEAAHVAARSGALGHASHLHGSADVLEPLLAELSERTGSPMSFDSYPYLRGSTILAMIVLPASVQAGGADATLARLADARVRGTLREAFAANARIASIRLSYLADPGWAWAEGLGLREAAERAGAELVDFCCDALIACDLAVGCVVDNGADRTEEDVRRMLRHPGHMASSDAIFLGSAPHPRGWGAFARLLARHVRELGDWTWGEAAWHLSGHAAERFRLSGRGRVAEGAVADLVVLDPLEVAARADYDDPVRPAVGVSHVLVGGAIALAHGELAHVRTGRALRVPRAAGASR